MATFQSNRFSRFNRVTKCRVCGKKTHSAVGGNTGVELCPKCLKESLEENERLDRGE